MDTAFSEVWKIRLKIFGLPFLLADGKNQSEANKMRLNPTKHKPNILILISSLLFVSGCGPLIVENSLGKRILGGIENKQDLIQQGKEKDDEILSQYRIVMDSKQQNRLKKISDTLVKASLRPDYDFTIRIYDDPNINAFVYRGQFIYVSNSFLENFKTDDEIAGVLAHEIAHLVADHSVNTEKDVFYSNIGLLLAEAFTNDQTANEVISSLWETLPASYSQRDEKEADILGAIIAYDAGYDITKMIAVFNKLWTEEENTLKEVEKQLTETYNKYTIAKRNYDIHVNAYNLYGSYQAKVDMDKAYYEMSDASNEFENLRQTYVEVQKGLSPLLRSHPIHSERIKTILTIMDYKSNKITLQEIQEKDSETSGVIGNLEQIYKLQKENLFSKEGLDSVEKMQEALWYAENGNSQKAISLINEVLTKTPNFDKARVVLVSLHFDLKDWNNAEKELLSLVSANPNNIEYLMSLVAVYGETKEFTKAENVIQNILKIDSKNGLAYAIWGQIYYEEQSYTKAIEKLTKALKFIKDDTESLTLAYILLSKSYTSLGDMKKANFYIKKGLEISPDNKELIKLSTI